MIIRLHVLQKDEFKAIPKSFLAQDTHEKIRYIAVPDFFMRVVGFEKEAVSYFSSTNSYCWQPSPICSA